MRRSSGPHTRRTGLRVVSSTPASSTACWRWAMTAPLLRSKPLAPLNRCPARTSCPAADGDRRSTPTTEPSASALLPSTLGGIGKGWNVDGPRDPTVTLAVLQLRSGSCSDVVDRTAEVDPGQPGTSPPHRLTNRTSGRWWPSVRNDRRRRPSGTPAQPELRSTKRHPRSGA